MKTRSDLQDEGGGGYLSPHIYNNPSLNISSSSVETFKIDNFKNSNDFILARNQQPEQETTLTKVRRKIQNCCTKKVLRKRLPIVNWLPNYNSECAIGDLVAGITVGLTVIPQALAYASVAGLPPEYGLYGSFLGSFIYIILGTCKDVPMGPTAIVSLMTYQCVRDQGPEHAILLCFLTGVIQLLMGILGLGFIIDFVSEPVSSGFTSAVALIIVTSQVKDILGVRGSGSTFIDAWRSMFQDMHNIRWWDTGFGITCISVLLILRIIGKFKISVSPVENPKNKLKRFINNAVWLISTSRNALLVIACGGIGYSFYLSGDPPFKLIGHVPPGLPAVKPPSFSMKKVVNGTEVTYNFWDMVSNLGSGVLVVPLIGLLENISICKAFGNGKPIYPTQELLAVGVSNVANSFFQAFPGTGSLSRSAVINSSGVKTPFAGLYTGFLVLVALIFLTPYFYFIPKSCLAAVIIAAVIFMVEIKVIKPMWRSKKSDLVVGLLTFLACLVLPLEYGILIGIGINLLFILYYAARPKINIQKLTSPQGAQYLVLTPDRSLIFPSSDFVKNLVIKQSVRQKVPIVIDCTHIFGADFTAAMAIEALTRDFALRGQALFFYNPKPSVNFALSGEPISTKIIISAFQGRKMSVYMGDCKQILKIDDTPACGLNLEFASIRKLFTLRTSNIKFTCCWPCRFRWDIDPRRSRMVREKCIKF